MRTLLCVVACVLLCSGIVWAHIGNSASQAQKPMIMLNDGNFDEEIAKGEWVVDFYTPWCKYCKELEPVWTQLGEALKSSGSPIKVAKLDVSVNPTIGSAQKIRGYPTIRYYRGGKGYDYEGLRTLPLLKKWADLCQISPHPPAMVEEDPAPAAAPGAPAQAQGAHPPAAANNVKVTAKPHQDPPPKAAERTDAGFDLLRFLGIDFTVHDLLSVPTILIERIQSAAVNQTKTTLLLVGLFIYTAGVVTGILIGVLYLVKYKAD